MIIKTVEFNEEEKGYIKSFIVGNALSEDRVFDRGGYEFIFDKDNLPFINDMELFVKVELYQEMSSVEPPDLPSIVCRTVLELKISLIENEGFYTVNTNLDYNFEESVKYEITI